MSQPVKEVKLASEFFSVAIVTVPNLMSLVEGNLKENLCRVLRALKRASFTACIVSMLC